MCYQNKIALVACYFGELPWYFNYFVHSCKYNPSVDFFIITDDTGYQNPDIPINVRLIYKTLAQVSQLTTAKLGFTVNITYGYKLCDFKPAYGIIFSELLKRYDFWGHCDIDIIFGNIRSFITDELLEEHELISVRHDWLSGCFLLYKNNEKLNTLFTQSKDYQKVFSSDVHYCFDETNFAHDEFTDGKPYQEIPTEIESMTHVVKRMEAEKLIKPFFDFFIIEGLPGKLKWENGAMFYRNKFEVLFYHLIYFKKLRGRKRRVSNLSSCFTISGANIYHHAKLKAAESNP